MNKRVHVMLEYLSNEDWDWIDMYANPDKITMSCQKIKNKVATRDGIFYHHWGDDHYSIKIEGIVGYSGMAGIQKIEQMYMKTGKLSNDTIKPQFVKPQIVTAYIEDRIYDCRFDSFAYRANADRTIIDYNMLLSVTKEHKLEEA